jgi:RimJ/RimL family protein N-acetyltransferase
MIRPLDPLDCRRLADVLGDEPTWPIMTHALHTGRGRAYAIGEIEHFAAAVVAPDYCPDEPQAWGDPEAIWRIVSQLSGWTAIEVPSGIAPPLAKLVGEGMRREVKLVDDLFYAADAPPPPYQHPAVRMLTIDDVDLLVSAPRELSGGNTEYARRMLSEGFYAAAIVDGRIVGRVEAFCRTPRYANLGAIVLPEFRRQGIAVAAAALVTMAVIESGQTAVWSTGEPNLASQGVAKRLGYRQIGRGTYVVLA